MITLWSFESSSPELRTVSSWEYLIKFNSLNYNIALKRFRNDLIDILKNLTGVFNKKKANTNLSNGYYANTW